MIIAHGITNYIDMQYKAYIKLFETYIYFDISKPLIAVKITNILLKKEVSNTIKKIIYTYFYANCKITIVMVEHL